MAQNPVEQFSTLAKSPSLRTVCTTSKIKIPRLEPTRQAANHNHPSFLVS